MVAKAIKINFISSVLGQAAIGRTQALGGLIGGHMLSAFFDDDGEHQPEIIEVGEVEEGDIYQNKCCNGYGWEVRLINPDELNPEYTTYWGMCLNGNCPDYQENLGPDDPWRGVSSICHEDFVEWLAYQDAAVTSAQQVVALDA